MKRILLARTTSKTRIQENQEPKAKETLARLRAAVEEMRRAKLARTVPANKLPV